VIDLFDQYGRLDPSKISPAQIEDLPEDKREALFACIAACRLAEDGEDRLKAARVNCAEKAQAYNLALEADQKANPPIDRIAAMRLVIAAQNKR
jgi:phytoene/squalene synthetase